jgi:hypothetical protein
LTADHHKRAHDDQERDRCIAKAMSSCSHSYGNTSSNREGEQQRPSALEDHPSNQCDSQNENYGHGVSVPGTVTPVHQPFVPSNSRLARCRILSGADMQQISTRQRIMLRAIVLVILLIVLAAVGLIRRNPLILY